MNFQSGDKLHSKLGKKLSNRYLSSDAFTSSAGRFGGRTVSRLGSILKKGASTYKTKKYYGVGQRAGLFEFKNIVFKIIVVFILLCILIYMIPTTRYFAHKVFAKSFDTSTSDNTRTDTLMNNEAYVAPELFKTDAFIGKQTADQKTALGSFVYDSITGYLVGAISDMASSTFKVSLFSDPTYKGNFFTMSETLELGDHTESATNTSTSTGTQSISFEGVGYGQLLAKIPPQIKIEIGTQIFAPTVHGLKPIAIINHVEPDPGSSFTLVYAQLLVPPTHIYKIRFDSPLP